MRKSNFLFIFTAFWVILSLAAPWADACTGFGAAGTDYVIGGGTLLAKNRDWKPEYNSVQVFVPGHGKHSYVALIADSYVKAGTNDAGLTLVSLSAHPSIPPGMTVPAGVAGQVDLNAEILQNYKNIYQVIKNRAKLFTNADSAFLLLSDGTNVATVEIVSKYLVKRRTPRTENYMITYKTDGVIYHTNHYLDPSFLTFNLNKDLFGNNVSYANDDSLARYERIGCLVNYCNQPPFIIDDFIKYSTDQQCGPYSIWRLNNDSECTLASWIVRTPSGGGPSEIFIRLANPTSDNKCAEKQDWKCTSLTTLDTFWAKPNITWTACD